MCVRSRACQCLTTTAVVYRSYPTKLAIECRQASRGSRRCGLVTRRHGKAARFVTVLPYQTGYSIRQAFVDVPDETVTTPAVSQELYSHSFCPATIRCLPME